MGLFRRSKPPKNRPANSHEREHERQCQRMGLDYGYVFRNEEEGYVVEATIPYGDGGTLAGAIFHLTGADAGGVDAREDRRKFEADLKELGMTESEVRKHMNMSQGELRRTINTFKKPKKQSKKQPPPAKKRGLLYWE